MTDEVTSKKCVFRLTVMVVDHDDIGESEIRAVLETASYPNRCIAPRVMNVESRMVRWSDRHPLNIASTMHQEFEDLFDDSWGQET